MVALFVILTIVAFLLADAILLAVRKRRATAPSVVEDLHGMRELLPEPSVPGGVFLSPSHLWVGLVPAGLARIGFDPLVLAALGNPDRIDGPLPGTRVRKGQPLFTARWGSRTVLFHFPAGRDRCPFRRPARRRVVGSSVEPVQARQDLGALPMAEEARRWFSQEWARLRDFVAAQSSRPAPAMALPDGGKPVAGWMRHEPDPVWDGFVESFLKG